MAFLAQPAWRPQDNPDSVQAVMDRVHAQLLARRVTMLDASKHWFPLPVP